MATIRQSGGEARKQENKARKQKTSGPHKKKIGFTKGYEAKKVSPYEKIRSQLVTKQIKS